MMFNRKNALNVKTINTWGYFSPAWFAFSRFTTSSPTGPSSSTMSAYMYKNILKARSQGWIFDVFPARLVKSINGGYQISADLDQMVMYVLNYGQLSHNAVVQLVQILSKYEILSTIVQYIPDYFKDEISTQGNSEWVIDRILHPIRNIIWADDIMGDIYKQIIWSLAVLSMRPSRMLAERRLKYFKTRESPINVESNSKHGKQRQAYV